MVSSAHAVRGASAPLVSVLLPVYNREGSVGRAIRSVLAQTYPHYEIIVIDDGSTDGSLKVVEGFGAQVTVVAQAHAGVYAARNAGLRRARGELVAFIDSDDAWLPDKLALQVPLMSRPEIGLVFGDAVHVSEPRENAPRTGRTSFGVSPPRRGSVADRFSWCNFVPTCTALARRRCLEESGGFSEANAISADYLAWFRIALRYELDYVERVVAEYTVHNEGISFALGRAVAARIELFSAELAQTADPAARAVLRRLLFNLSLHLALAALRGRAREVANPLRLAWSTASGTTGLDAAPWLAAFAAEQFRVRTRRLFS